MPHRCCEEMNCCKRCRVRLGYNSLEVRRISVNFSELLISESTLSGNVR